MFGMCMLSVTNPFASEEFEEQAAISPGSHGVLIARFDFLECHTHVWFFLNYSAFVQSICVMMARVQPVVLNLYVFLLVLFSTTL